MFAKEANFVHKICNICRQPFRTKQTAGDEAPGGLLKKVSQSSRLASCESIEIHFLRRRVRRKKHPARKRSVAAPPLAAGQGAERSETLSSVCQMGKLMKDYSASR